MNTGPDFIGIGVEKAGTSWIFACLYEHPEICIPRKEINFFTDTNLYSKGKQWYESYYNNRCKQQKVKGEYSTAYFYDDKSAERIQHSYPDARLIVCLRDPIKRAISGYMNAIKAGTLSKDISFNQACELDNDYLLQGKYKQQFERYFKYFTPSQFLILIYEDIITSPQQFIQNIYRYLQVDDRFIPASLHERINTTRVPDNVRMEKWSNTIAHYLQKTKLGEKLWWLIKQSKIPAKVRELNTATKEKPKISKSNYEQLKKFYLEDFTYVESLLNRNLKWLSEENL